MSRTARPTVIPSAVLAMAAALAAAASAQPPSPAPTTPPTTPPAPQPAQAPSQPKDAPPAAAPQAPPSPPAPVPTLDELLGLGGAAPGAGDPTRDDLNKRLADENPADLFEQAVGLMGATASRLGDAADTGLDTQRLQEDTLRKLDAMISQMRRQQQQQQQQKQRQQSPQEQQEQQRRLEQSTRQETRSADSQNIDPPGRRDGALRPGLEAAKAAWGALPARIRDLLLQGSGEKFSSAYERMTEEYYRKLAEQKP